MVLLLPKDLKQSIAELAKSYSVTQSQIVTFLLYEALLLYQRGNIQFENYLLPTNSPRYEWSLVHSFDRERYERISEKKQKRSKGAARRETP